MGLDVLGYLTNPTRCNVVIKLHIIAQSGPVILVILYPTRIDPPWEEQ